MSLVLIGHESHPRYRLVVAANRDEYHHRETEPATWWEDAPGVLAGRDLERDGTWLGITRDGRFAAITAYRDPKCLREGLRSRGLIVSDFLDGESGSTETLRALSERPRDYNPFSVLMHDGRTLGWCSNRIRGARRLGAGIYGLSNHLLDTPWHKVATGKRELAALLRLDRVRAGDLLALLGSRTEGPDGTLPRTGVGMDCERWLSPPFVVGQTFGTRSSTVLLVSHDGEVEFVERRFDNLGVEVATVRFTFSLEPDGGHRTVPPPARGMPAWEVRAAERP